ncbi:hypothetical protein CSKR_112237 [Clonorchis sinensis]|uniref:C2H2-type domain-containing protein n=2 Tax=Clonorchis sinensis TaxID=79923 RepID=A0A3R7D6R1_CLOSI|nr:hypothetical protein CSKR_112237 [Clonorchis sinensis]
MPLASKQPICSHKSNVEHPKFINCSHRSNLEHDHEPSDTIFSSSPPLTTSFSPPFEFSVHSGVQDGKQNESVGPSSPVALDLRIHRSPKELSNAKESNNLNGSAEHETTSVAFNIQNILGSHMLSDANDKLLNSNQPMDVKGPCSSRTEAIFMAISSLIHILGQRKTGISPMENHPDEKFQLSSNTTVYSGRQSLMRQWLLEQQWPRRANQLNSDSWRVDPSEDTQMTVDECASHGCSELNTSVKHTLTSRQQTSDHITKIFTPNPDTTANSVDDETIGKGPVILYHPEPADSKSRIREMIETNDPRLKYVNDGAAIRNPFAMDRKVQLAYLTSLLCVRTENGEYVCKGCGRTTLRLRPMQQHLLSHSASKFNLCVRCLKGFNDKYDMKRHTRKHTMVRPYVCPECGRSFSQRCSLEGHRRKIHKVQLNFSRNQRREVVRVCEACGFSCTSSAEMLQHTVSFHPDSSSIPRLKRQLARQVERNKRPSQSYSGVLQQGLGKQGNSALSLHQPEPTLPKQTNMSPEISFEDSFESENPDGLEEDPIDNSCSSNTTTFNPVLL